MKCPVCQYEPPSKALFIRMVVKTRVPDTRIFAIKGNANGTLSEDPNFGIYICPKCAAFLGDTTLLEAT